MKKEMRRKDREVTNLTQIMKIVDDAKILHLGLIDGAFPYVVPLHYGYEYDKQKDKFTFYMHGARVGHKLDVIAKSPNACIELETDMELDSGGEVPCEYGSFYSSMIGQGKASIVSDIDEKKHGLNLLMNNQTGRSFVFTEEMANMVAVIKVEVDHYTAKARMRK